jgi:hypothetical protein
MYIDLMNDQIRYLWKYIWKIVPLKVKIFMWFLHRKILLVKDKLAKRNWWGCKTCCFCHKDQSIQRLLFWSPFRQKVFWRIVYTTFILSPPANVTNLFEIDWPAFLRKMLFKLEWEFVWFFGPCGMFKMILPLTNLDHQLLCRLTLWIFIGFVRGPISNQWRSGIAIDFGCRHLEMVPRDFYNRCGWAW